MADCFRIFITVPDGIFSSQTCCFFIPKKIQYGGKNIHSASQQATILMFPSSCVLMACTSLPSFIAITFPGLQLNNKSAFIHVKDI